MAERAPESRLRVTPLLAEKRWGHGRLRQWWRRFVVCRRDHDWSAWTPAGASDSRRCLRECGAIEVRTWGILEAGRRVR